jgi:hypothetical protein
MSSQQLAASYRSLVAIAGLGGLGGALVSMVKSAIDSGDQLVKLSQKSGFAVERLAELKHGAMLSDVSIEQLSIGLREFNKSITESADPTSKAARLFRELGVDVKKGPDAALRQFSDALSRMADGSTKSTLAVEILGRAGADMIPWLNQGAAGMESSAEEARKLGLVMSQEAALAAEEFNDSLTRLASSSSALGIAIAEPALPALNALAEKMMEIRTEGITLAGVLDNLAVALKAMPLPGAPQAGNALQMALAAGRAEQQRYRGGPDLWGRVGSINLSGLDAELQAGAPPPGAPNSKAMDRILSGVDERERDDAAKRARAIAALNAKAASEFAKSLAEPAEELQAYADSLIYTWDAAGNRIQVAREQYGEMQKQADAAIAAMVESAEVATEIAEGMVYSWDQAGNRIEMTVEAFDEVTAAEKRAAEAGIELGWAFASSFERAIIEGEGVRDVLSGIAKDAARILLRQHVTEPMANALAGALSGMLGGGSFNTAAMDVPARASGGPVSTGRAYLVGERGAELFVPGSSGQIVPNGAGGVTITQHLHFSANTPAAVRDAVMAAAPMLTEAARRGVMEARARGAG